MGLFRTYGGAKAYKRVIRNTLISLLLLLLASFVFFPIYYMVISSFGPATETGSASYSLIPRRFSLDSYKFFFNFSKSSIRWLFNSLIVAGTLSITNVVFATLAGYAFAKLRFPGSKVLFFLLLVAMMVPYQVTQVPLYMLVVNKLHLQDTYTALILPSIISCYNVFMAKQFFTSLPTPIIEAAIVDGCSQPGIVARIVLPLSKTILAVIALQHLWMNGINFSGLFLYVILKKCRRFRLVLKTSVLQIQHILHR